MWGMNMATMNSSWNSFLEGQFEVFNLPFAITSASNRFVAASGGDPHPSPRRVADQAGRTQGRRQETSRELIAAILSV